MPPLFDRSQNQCSAQVLVGGVILEVAVEQLAQHLGLDQAADRVGYGVVALHQVGHEQPVALLRRGDHLVGLRDGHRQRLLADHVLAGPEGLHRLGVVQERRRGDVDEIDVVASQHLPTSSMSGMPNRCGRGIGGLPVRPGHARQRHARDLGELLEGIEPETSAADHSQADSTVVHRRSFRQGRGVSHSLVITPIFPGFRARVNSGSFPGYTGGASIDGRGD